MFTWLRRRRGSWSRRLHRNRDKMMRAFCGYSTYMLSSLKRDLRISSGTMLRYLSEFENRGWIIPVNNKGVYKGQFQSTEKGRKHFRQTLNRQ